MKQVVFDMPVKYNGIRYSAHQPINVEDNEVALLVSQGGHTSNVSKPVEEPVKQEVQSTDEVVDAKKLETKLMSMSNAKIVEYAHEHGIELVGVTRKSDMVRFIVENQK